MKLKYKTDEERKQAQKIWADNYLKTQDNIVIRVPKGRKDELKSEAKKRGLSLNMLTVKAIEEYLENHPTED